MIMKERNTWESVLIAILSFFCSAMNVYMLITDDGNVHSYVVLAIAAIGFFCYGVRALWKVFRQKKDDEKMVS